MEQDPTFAFRIMVDIASKGLSPAINDPTTAVLAIDQIQHLLRNVGTGIWTTIGSETRRAGCGSFTGLRTGRISSAWRSQKSAISAATSIQVARRLRAMLDNLIQTLPEQRAPLLRQELNLLHRTAKRLFVDRRIARWPMSAIFKEWAESTGIAKRAGKKQPATPP